MTLKVSITLFPPLTKSLCKTGDVNIHSCNPSLQPKVGEIILSKDLVKLRGLLRQGPYKVLHVKVTQSCPTLCDTVDYTVHGIL